MEGGQGQGKASTLPHIPTHLSFPLPSNILLCMHLCPGMLSLECVYRVEHSFTNCVVTMTRQSRISLRSWIWPWWYMELITSRFVFHGVKVEARVHENSVSSDIIQQCLFSTNLLGKPTVLKANITDIRLFHEPGLDYKLGTSYFFKLENFVEAGVDLMWKGVHDSLH